MLENREGEKLDFRHAAHGRRRDERGWVAGGGRGGGERRGRAARHGAHVNSAFPELRAFATWWIRPEYREPFSPTSVIFTSTSASLRSQFGR